jgi:hypothetical protein
VAGDRGGDLDSVVVGDAALEQREDLALVALPRALERDERVAGLAWRLAQAPEDEAVLVLAIRSS